MARAPQRGRRRLVRRLLAPARWLRSASDRVRARQRLLRTVALFYHPNYAAPSLRETSRVPNIEPRRGELVLGKLAEHRLIEPEDVKGVALAPVSDLARFHTGAYLARTLEPEFLARVFGLLPEDVDVDELIRAQRSAVAGTVEAAVWAARGRRRITFNFGGGFHHAEPDSGSGFCLYNDVGVAIAKLRATGYRDRIAIVDLDYHQGNGNLAAYREDDSVLVYSIHGSVWAKGDSGMGAQIHLPSPVHDKEYLDCLHDTLGPMLEAFGPRLVFFISGNDVLKDDRLGDFDLSIEAVVRRDREVLRVAEDLKAGLVVTLGGGYSRRAWHATYHFARTILTGSDAPPTPLDVPVERHFARIASSIDPQALQREPSLDLTLTQEELFGDLSRRPPARRFLGYYSAQGIEFALERYGMLALLRSRGFSELSIDLDPKDPTRQVARIHARRAPSTDRHLLVEVVVRKRSVVVDDQSFQLLAIEWLTLQDPTRSFSIAHPALPGQAHPGLGAAREALVMFEMACRRLSLAGIWECPSHFHGAAFSAPRMFFIDPIVEGRFRAVLDFVSELGPIEATWAVHRGEIHIAGSEVYEWVPAPRVLPLTDALHARFEGAYQVEVKRVKASLAGRLSRVPAAPDATPGSG